MIAKPGSKLDFFAITALVALAIIAVLLGGPRTILG
jgi:hypothetical protein